MIKETSTEEFEERRKHSPLKDIVYIIRNNLENGRHFLIKEKKLCIEFLAYMYHNHPLQDFVRSARCIHFKKHFLVQK